ncbi:MAG: prolyl oligopeptidase family serine peptidase [Muribaculaceae bacterium]|nr:prolyl oligopeptidase family serine peptidase [Muribaculaceae bacterium]
MKNIFFILALAWLASAMLGCDSSNSNGASSSTDTDTVVVHDTVEVRDTVHDTVTVLPAGTFTYNLPCQVVHIHPEKEGKALLFLWLHGGVTDRKFHSYSTHPNHWDYAHADDDIINYLRKTETKAIALLPMCHKADRLQCVRWQDCYADVKAMIDQYVKSGLVDPKRIYVAGSSDGGDGTWNYVSQHPQVWAAAIAMQCNGPQMTSVSTYFYNSRDEADCESQVNRLKQSGANIIDYEHHPELGHPDDIYCTAARLAKFFSHRQP